MQILRGTRNFFFLLRTNEIVFRNNFFQIFHCAIITDIIDSQYFGRGDTIYSQPRQQIFSNRTDKTIPRNLHVEIEIKINFVRICREIMRAPSEKQEKKLVRCDNTECLLWTDLNRIISLRDDELYLVGVMIFYLFFFFLFVELKTFFKYMRVSCKCVRMQIKRYIHRTQYTGHNV